MPKTIYEFNTPGNYTLNNIKIDNSKASLDLVPNPDQIFSNTFDNDTGFTYESSKAEFNSGILRQIDQTPSGSILASLFNSKDLNWHKGGGSVTGTLNGTPTFSSGKMVCSGSHGVYFSRSSSSLESHKFKYTPNYTGSPPTNVNLITCWNGSNNNNKFFLINSPSGNNIRLQLHNSTGLATIPLAVIGGWNPTSGQEYEFEIVLDSISGVVRVFIDGALLGTNSPGAWTRSIAATRYYIGASPTSYNVAEGSFDDYIMFENIQHTTAYIPGYSIVPFIYATTKIDGPVFSYTGIGTILTVDDAEFTESGSPRYIVAGRYWNGTSWAVSDGTYSQSTDSSTLIANLEELNAAGAEFIPWSVVFPDSNTQASISSFSVEITGQILASSGSLITDSYFVTNSIQSFLASGTVVPSGDYIGFFAVVGLTTNYYHDGTNWVESDGDSQAQTNSYEDFMDNISTLVANNVQVQLGVYMESGDQSTTPEIDQASFEHDFGAINPGEPLRCNVYMYLADLEGQALESVGVTVKLLRELNQYAEASSYVVAGSLLKNSDNEGFVNFALIRSSEFEVSQGTMKYVIEFKISDDATVNNIELDEDSLPQSIEFEVPDLESVNITDQIQAV